MSAANHCERFRPLRGGIVIVAQTLQHYGTLGLIVTRDGLDRWGLTCAHVLGPLGGPIPDGDGVYQPDDSVIAHRVGLTVPTKADFGLDCAAFSIDAGVSVTSEILGIGPLAAPVDPQVGDRVVKSGRSTGVTEGEVTAVNGEIVTIELRSDFPNAYDLSDPGDSGAVWCEVTTRAPMVLHTGGSPGGISTARGVRLRTALAALGMGLLP